MSGNSDNVKMSAVQCAALVCCTAPKCLLLACLLVMICLVLSVKPLLTVAMAAINYYTGSETTARSDVTFAIIEFFVYHFCSWFINL